MANPHDVLAQLLSENQADILSTLGESSWQAISGVLSAVLDSAPMLDSADGRLVMPDEIAGNYAQRHIAIPIHLSAGPEQEATAFVTFPTDSIAAFFEIDTDDSADEEGQVLAAGTPVARQIIQTLNTEILKDAPDGMALALGDVTTDSMAATLEEMDEPALALHLRFGGLECSLVLPGTFLDILGTALPTSAVTRPARAAAAAAAAAQPAPGMPFSLTAEEIAAAELIDMPAPADPRSAELVGAARGQGMASVMQNLRNQSGDESPGELGTGGIYGRDSIDASTGLPPRPPTPISNAPTAQKARFAPLPEADPPAFRGNMDLLSSLQMNVTVELGRTQLTVAEVLALGSGSVVELDRLAGEPVDILVNDRIIARGEVVVVDENFGVRVVEVIRRGGEAEERAS